MKILSVRIDGEWLEIKAEVNKGGWVQTLTWYYSPHTRGHNEHVDSDVALKNPIGELLTNLLIPGNRLDLELDEDSTNAVLAMEEKL